jgi:hypothetical protein
MISLIAPMKSFKQFNRDVSWEARFYVLLSVFTIIIAHLCNAWDSQWIPVILSVLLLILFVETIAILLIKEPLVLRTIKWIILILGLALLFIGLT